MDNEIAGSIVCVCGNLNSDFVGSRYDGLLFRPRFVVGLLFALDNPFRPTGSTLNFALFQRTFGSSYEEAFR